jgi:hypothetical protein
MCFRLFAVCACGQRVVAHRLTAAAAAARKDVTTKQRLALLQTTAHVNATATTFTTAHPTTGFHHSPAC